MAEPAIDYWEPDVSHLITEDDTPVDNWFQGKQQDLLTETLRVSWEVGRPFVSGADVGLFYAVKEAIVPDVLLSIGVEAPADYWEKNRRSYYVWVFGKPPEIVVEVVSDKKGGEDKSKLALYSKIKVPYYVIYDPFRQLSQRILRIYQLSGASYIEKVDGYFPEVGLGVTTWEGNFDGLEGTWLRWTHPDGSLLETGLECSHRTGRVADEERIRRLALEARLRELGVDPDSV